MKKENGGAGSQAKAHRGRRRLLKALLIVFLVLAVLSACWAVFYFHRSDPADLEQYETDNPHITGRTMACAHRSGGGLYPEESLLAFRYCAENPDFAIDYFEFDLHLTKDGRLVLLHDDTLDRTTDSETVFGQTGVLVRDKTLEELKKLNIGARFVNDAGETPFADPTSEELESLRILTLEETLDYLTSVGDFRYIIELKDGGEDGNRAADLLYGVLKERGLLQSALITSFRDDTLQYVENTYPDAMRGAGVKETIWFGMAAYFRFRKYEPTFDAVQLPFGDVVQSKGLNSGLVSVVNYAHAHNVAVQYWTVNDEEDIAYLRSIGADAVESDYPDLLTRVLKGSE